MSHGAPTKSHSRSIPVAVAPIIIGHTRYGDLNGYNNGVLRIFDTQSGKEIKAVEIYRYPIDPSKESDVQSVFFSSMTLTNGGGYILIENERYHRFLFDLKTQEVSELKQPCELKPVKTEKVSTQWRVLVELSTSNILPAEDFYLDRISFGDSQSLMNNLFDVRSEKNVIEYRGDMVKRAPPAGINHIGMLRYLRPLKKLATPKEFILLEPGESHKVTIDIGKDYAFPSEGGTFSVQYQHHNQFSPNDVDMVSNVISVELKP